MEWLPSTFINSIPLTVGQNIKCEGYEVSYMKDPIRIMLLGIAILIISIFIQNIPTGETESVSNVVQVYFCNWGYHYFS